jgi:hypothetical protein
MNHEIELYTCYHGESLLTDTVRVIGDLLHACHYLGQQMI